MPVFKNESNNTWYVMARYVNWKGERKQKCKRGFTTKREAQEWERMFQLQTAADLDMSFEAFMELYTRDMKNRLKENTWLTKEHIIRTKILPYFAKLKISEITTKEVVAWQNEMLAYRDERKKPYSQTYLKTLHNQLSAIFNHAVRYYGLRSNPAAKVGNMGSEEHKEMLFWTTEEYKRFADEMMDKPVSFYAFEMLYWCGIREGELLALTPADFDFENETVRINKSYQRLHGEDVITAPKTKKSIRTIKMPTFLVEEMQEYLKMLYGLKKKDRIFTVTKHLSVLDFKKKERAKEVAELDAVKQEKQTELAQIQQQTQEAKRECQKQTKELNEIAPILQGLESLSAQYSQRPEEWVPEAGTFETAKSYRDKKAIPLINKLVKILYSLHHKYWKVKNECAKFMERYADEREANQNLRQRIEMLQEENTRLKAVEHNFGRVWSYYGAEQVKRVVELMAGRERAAQNVQRQKREH